MEREGIFEQRLVNLTGSASTIDIDVKEDHVPEVYVTVSTAAPRTAAPPAGPDLPDFGKPRGYSGMVELPVRTDTRTIQIDVGGIAASYRPGSTVSLTLKTSLGGKPLAGAEIALVAADRGVLDLIDYRIQNPIDFFYSSGNYPDRVAHYDSRDLLMDPVTWKQASLPGGDEKGESAPTIGASQVRKDFRPTAVFRTGLITGADGTVAVSFPLPDQLTRFRLTAVAVKDDRFGITENELLVQNPINVRTALPRRMRVGDHATAGVVLTNLDAAPHTVNVRARITLLQLTGADRKTITLKPGETAELPFDLSAPVDGSAHFTFEIQSDILNEQLEDTMAVASEPVTETVTLIGKTTGMAKEGIAVPSAFLGVPTEGLSLTLDSTIASALVGAIHYLEIYPYDCLEQVTSKMFARVLFPNLPGAGKADLTDIARFAVQDGGFSYWPGSHYSNYYVSLRVAHLLAIAQDKGMDIPDGIDASGLLYYLSTGWQDQDTYLKAYALYVMSLWGRREPAMAKQLAAMGDKLGVFGYGFLGLAYQAMGDDASAKAILTRLKSFLRPGTRTVTLVGTVNDWLWYGGDLQAKSLLLMLYAQLQPDSQLVLGLANDLLSGNRAGSWGNTSNAGWVPAGIRGDDRGRRRGERGLHGVASSWGTR